MKGMNVLSNRTLKNMAPPFAHTIVVNHTINSWPHHSFTHLFLCRTNKVIDPTCIELVHLLNRTI
ncbi:hypothetical protein Hanom_Chr12g01098791 [Helianthus anomalus]